MPIKNFKPITPGQRFKSVLIKTEITKSKPERTLILALPKISGRSKGKITQRGRGARHKRNYREIDFKRDKINISAKIAAIEYDPNRSAAIALLHYIDGEKKYILAPTGIKIGQNVISGEKAQIKVGNALPLGKIPIGTVVHNVELTPGAGGQLARSAGGNAIISAREGNWVHLKLPSKEIRKILASCYATIGQLSNIDWKNLSAGKAGKSRHRGRRPHVRGVAMDPGSHPHGGGEGRSGTGMNPKTRHGKRAFGKTRKLNKPSNKFILKRRK